MQSAMRIYFQVKPQLRRGTLTKFPHSICSHTYPRGEHEETRLLAVVGDGVPETDDGVSGTPSPSQYQPPPEPSQYQQLQP
jgi:hypothetical protein